MNLTNLYTDKARHRHECGDNIRITCELPEHQATRIMSNRQHNQAGARTPGPTRQQATGGSRPAQQAGGDRAQAGQQAQQGLAGAGQARMRGSVDSMMAARLLDIDCLIADFRRIIPSDSTTAMAIDGRAPRLAIARICLLYTSPSPRD